MEIKRFGGPWRDSNGEYHASTQAVPCDIFKNAYFGKPYKTRDGRKVIYCGTFENDSLFNTKVVINTDVDQTSDYIDFRWYTQEGKSSIADSPDDIVSEWQLISEEELDKMAIEECDKLLKDEIFTYNGTECVVLSDAERCWKLGYCQGIKK